MVGGGDSAADEALTLTEYADRVLLFHRRDQLRAQKVLQDRLVRHPKIEILWNTEVQGILGEETVFRGSRAQCGDQPGYDGRPVGSICVCRNWSPIQIW